MVVRVILLNVMRIVVSIVKLMRTDVMRVMRMVLVFMVTIIRTRLW